MSEKKLIPIIGMEIHVELKTASKMFCSCKNDPFNSEPNTNICPVCTGQPGSLPIPNKKALEWILKIGKALNCNVRELSKFDRKHYFYPDLPKAYQISQYDEPICEKGYIELNSPLEDIKTKIGITRVHMEEDTAKLEHLSCHSEPCHPGEGRDLSKSFSKKNGGKKNSDFHQDDKYDNGASLVDFNRAGVPLVEIVSDPDIQNSKEAKKYCQELQLIFRYLKVSDADMEKGEMRCEANISLQEAGKFEIKNGVVEPVGRYILNNKVELKNINSFKAIEKGIEYEIKRQTKLIEEGVDFPQQTRGWDENKQETVMQREKETAADYRYFPEPDIPPFEPLKIASDIKIGELPQARRSRFVEEYGFSLADSIILNNDKNWSEFTEKVISELYDWLKNLTIDEQKKIHPVKSSAKAEVGSTKFNRARVAQLAGGWLTSKLMGVLSEKKKTIIDFKTSPENFAELIALIYTKRINSTNAQKILVGMVESDKNLDPTHIMEEKGLGQIDDQEKLNEIVDEVIKNYPEQVEGYQAGKEPLLKFLIGMAMKASEGSANPQKVEELLKIKIK